MNDVILAQFFKVFLDPKRFISNSYLKPSAPWEQTGKAFHDMLTFVEFTSVICMFNVAFPGSKSEIQISRIPLSAEDYYECFA